MLPSRLQATVSFLGWESQWPQWGSQSWLPPAFQPAPGRAGKRVRRQDCLPHILFSRKAPPACIHGTARAACFPILSYAHEHRTSDCSQSITRSHMRKFALALSLCSSVVLFAADTAQERLSDATKVFNEIIATREPTVAPVPFGRQPAASTDVQMSAEILSWSRAKGLFAGIALHGATLRPDNDANEELYGNKLTNKEILAGGQKTPPVAIELVTALDRYSPREDGHMGDADRKKQ